MPPVGADVLGRPQPGPPGGRPLPRTIENLGRPQPPHNAISFDRGCGPPRTSAPTDSLTFHSCATTNRIGRALRVAMPPAGSTPIRGQPPPLIPCDSRSTYQSENFHCPPPSTFSTSFRDHPPSCCKCGVLKHFTVIFEKLGVANRTEAVVKLWGTSLERTWPPGMSTAKFFRWMS